MAQVTESLAREFLQHCERGHHPPMTIHETEQLIRAWFKLDRYRKALNNIAAWNDQAGNARLEATGSYGVFDEPNAVATAREALSDE